MTSGHAKQEALLDELLKDYTDPQDMLGKHGLLTQLTKRVVERVLEAELTAHLGYAPHVRHGTEDGNARNGKGQKTVHTDTGPRGGCQVKCVTFFTPAPAPRTESQTD